MKKLIFSAALVLSLGLAACGGNEESTDTTEEQIPVNDTEQTENTEQKLKEEVVKVEEEKAPLTEAEIEEQEFNNRLDGIKTTINNIIDEDFTFDTTLKDFQLNQNIGTDNPDDYIALVYLSYDQQHSVETTKKWIDQYTGHLAASLGEKEKDISSLTIFWETPNFKENWNTAEFNLTNKDGSFYYDSQNYDATVFN